MKKRFQPTISRAEFMDWYSAVTLENDDLDLLRLVEDKIIKNGKFSISIKDYWEDAKTHATENMDNREGEIPTSLFRNEKQYYKLFPNSRSTISMELLGKVKWVK